jgi:hypothetical protein
MREILPHCFEVERGMVYRPAHRSREADVVLWDAQNYPILSMADHSFYFATSVKAVLESKSTFSSDNLEDVLLKTKSVRDIVSHHGTNLDDLLEKLLLDIRCLKKGHTYGGMIISHAHIGTAAMFREDRSRDSSKEQSGRVPTLTTCGPTSRFFWGPA